MTPQTVARLALEQLVKNNHPVPTPDSVDPHLFDADEQNALQYAAGYLFLFLKRKYTSLGKDEVVGWIDKQTDTGPVTSADSYLKFTKLWITKVNRGGLFCVQDKVYIMFLVMEQLVREHLSTQGMNREEVVKHIEEDEQVQLYWSAMATPDAFDQALLRQAIQLWVTIRGFSYASALVEEYKKSCGTLKRKQAHRKDLKRKSDRKKKKEHAAEC